MYFQSDFMLDRTVFGITICVKMSCHLDGSDLLWKKKRKIKNWNYLTSFSSNEYDYDLRKYFSQSEIISRHGHIFWTISYGCYSSYGHFFWCLNANPFKSIRTESELSPLKVFMFNVTTVLSKKKLPDYVANMINQFFAWIGKMRKYR